MKYIHDLVLILTLFHLLMNALLKNNDSFQPSLDFMANKLKFKKFLSGPKRWTSDLLLLAYAASMSQLNILF